MALSQSCLYMPIAGFNLLNLSILSLLLLLLVVDGTRNDFDDSIQQVIFEPSQGISEQIVTINLVDDIINEAQEGFYVMMNVTESGLTDQITLVRNGIALIRINDNDRKLMYTHAERRMLML